MKITTLIENKACDRDSDLVSEWGLSLHIAFNGHEILFDTGASASFARNAERLSVNIASVETAVISHHHFDHGGGLQKFLELNQNAKIYLGEIPEGDCYFKILPFIRKYIGLDKVLFEANPDQFIFVRERVEILPDVFIIPHIFGKYPKPSGNKRLFIRSKGKLMPDEFTHEIVMAIKERGKLVVFTGCSHNGILNMIEVVANAFENIPIKAVIGGFHMVASPPFNAMAGTKRQVEDIGKAVLDHPVDVTYTGHCTGMKAYDILKGVMGERIKYIQTGTSFEI